ncbi:MAG: type II toxin-antitoxin system Phd/YefM family antitoxin [Planctomycetes bacterium]|nr:type II toxin-antitoxin system Phd/YefM family antitoxin [Planctomycetota bacterium]
MKTASEAELKSGLRAVLEASAREPVVVKRNGKPVAVLVGVHDEEEVERLLMTLSPRLQAILERSRKQIRDGEVLSHEEFWAAVAETRASKQRGRKRKKPA